jgi:hypothetical protein
MKKNPNFKLTKLDISRSGLAEELSYIARNLATKVSNSLEAKIAASLKKIVRKKKKSQKLFKFSLN